MTKGVLYLTGYFERPTSKRLQISSSEISCVLTRVPSTDHWTSSPPWFLLGTSYFLIPHKRRLAATRSDRSSGAYPTKRIWSPPEFYLGDPLDRWKGWCGV